jgi:hypothetical protein
LKKGLAYRAQTGEIIGTVEEFDVSAILRGDELDESDLATQAFEVPAVLATFAHSAGCPSHTVLVVFAEIQLGFLVRRNQQQPTGTWFRVHKQRQLRLHCKSDRPCHTPPARGWFHGEPPFAHDPIK